MDGDGAGDGVHVGGVGGEGLDDARVAEEEVAPREGEAEGGGVAEGDPADVAVGVDGDGLAEKGEGVAESGDIRVGGVGGGAGSGSGRPVGIGDPSAISVDVPSGVSGLGGMAGEHERGDRTSEDLSGDFHGDGEALGEVWMTGKNH